VPELATPEPLRRGEPLCVAVLDGTPDSNTIWVEARSDSGFQVVTEAPDSETGIRRRWDWMGLTAPTYGWMLHELGDRMVHPPHWASDDLLPCFPCRPRSRDEMRIEARTLGAAPPTSATWPMDR
jgi:hypothetical protein